VVQIYRVITEFQAQQLPWEPLRVENFAPGDLVVILTTEDSYTTFCRHNSSIELSAREQFVIQDWEFNEWTEIHRL
jgi:hypothetical protein